MRYDFAGVALRARGFLGGEQVLHGESQGVSPEGNMAAHGELQVTMRTRVKLTSNQVGSVRWLLGELLFMIAMSFHHTTVTL